MNRTADQAAPGLTPPLPGDDAGTGLPRRSALADDRGLTFRELRQTLTPRFGVVWSQLAMGYGVLALSAWGVAASAGVLPDWLRVVAGAVVIGFAQAYIQLFFHEAAHYNLAPGRARNDLLANVFVGALHGLEITAYRAVHFEHHRRLGTTMDSERSYFDPLNMRFFAESLLGIKGLKVLTRRERVLERAGVGAGVSAGVSTRVSAEVRGGVSAGVGATVSSSPWLQRVAAAAIHTAVVGASLYFRQHALAIAWTLGTLSIMPLCVALRQLLEHRSERADPTADYTVVDHGAVNRLFGAGPFASTFGGAGFNRHLLHHWEPQISYTRLGELERYLMRTGAAEALRSRRSTYWQTFWALVSW